MTDSVPLDDRLWAALPYRPEAFLIDRIVWADRQAARVVARMPTTRALPFLDAQRHDSPLHLPHVPGGVLVHLTGMLGCALAWLAHGLSFAEGWVGYGAKIHEAEFKRLARVGPPLELEAAVTRHRPGRERHVLRYEFDFRQDGEVVYHGDQTAVFQRVSGA